MARTKKSVATEATIENEVIKTKKETPAVSTEDLLALIAQMKSTMESQAQQIEELKSEKLEPKIKEVKKTFVEVSNDMNHKTATITSLYKGGVLILTGDHSHWLNFGQSESMNVKEVVKIVERTPQLLEQGYFSVDSWLAEEYGWPINDKAMTVEQLDNFFNMTVEEAMQAFLNTTAGQRTSILDYIETRIQRDGEFENINLAQKIGDLIGKNYIKLLSDNAMDDEDREMMRKMGR